MRGFIIRRERHMDYIYERLEVWKNSVDFANQVTCLLGAQTRDKPQRGIIEKAEVSSANIAIAIARAKGSPSRNDIMRQLYRSRRSLYETMTLLEIFRRNKWISDDQYADFKSSSKKITSSIMGMLRTVRKEVKNGIYL